MKEIILAFFVTHGIKLPTLPALPQVNLPHWLKKAAVIVLVGVVLFALMANYAKTRQGWFWAQIQSEITLLVERKVVKSAIKIQNEATDKLIAEKEHELDLGTDLDTRNWNKLASELPVPPLPPVAEPSIEPKLVHSVPVSPLVEVGPQPQGPEASAPIPPAKSKVKHESLLKRIKKKFSRKPSFARDLNRAERDANRLLEYSTRP